MISNEKINEIKKTAIENIEHLLDELGLDIDSAIVNNDELRLPCPIHNGDNPTSFSINTKYGTWRCYSHKCHESHGSSIFDLVNNILFKDNKSFFKSLCWIAEKLSINIDNNEIQDPEFIYIDKINSEIKQRKNIINSISDPEYEMCIPLESIKNEITISKYFLEKGFSKETLSKFMVGYCSDRTKPMYLRSFAPVIDCENKNIIGVTGRIIYEKCNFCPWYHIDGKGCPKDNPNIRGYSKWKHFGFKKSKVLYNMNNAKDYIKNGKIIITEGPKEVWFLYQHGIKNVICLFGLDISNFQIKKLLDYGVSTIYLMLDNDEKGISASDKFINMCGSYFNIVNINNIISLNSDIDELSDNEMKQFFIPIIEGIMNA